MFGISIFPFARAPDQRALTLKLFTQDNEIPERLRSRSSGSTQRLAEKSEGHSDL